MLWYDMICYDDSDDYLTSSGTLLFWLVVTGTWFYDFPIQLGISWSQLITSYFSEGLVYHQAASCIPVDPPKSRRIFFRTNMAKNYKWIDMIDGAAWFFEKNPCCSVLHLLWMLFLTLGPVSVRGGWLPRVGPISQLWRHPTVTSNGSPGRSPKGPGHCSPEGARSRMFAAAMDFFCAVRKSGGIMISMMYHGGLNAMTSLGLGKL